MDTSEILTAIVRELTAVEELSERSQQEEIGWSEILNCERALGYKMSRTWPSEQPDLWPAIRGTRLHQAILDVAATVFGDNCEIEFPVSYRGVPGHVDLLIFDPPMVVDVKTTTLANAEAWAANDDFLTAKWTQVMGYAAGAIAEDYVDEEGLQVALLVVPVDGTFSDWRIWSRPFDRSMADRAVDRLEDIRRRLDADGVDALWRQRPWAFCKSWCRFFSLCRTELEPPTEEITDPELVALVDAYGRATEAKSNADAAMKSLRAAVDGLNGRAGQWTITTSPPTVRRTLDADAVREHFAAEGGEPPMVEQKVSGRITVRRAQ
ncbi:MAG: hypothetical protein IRZ06_12170 [Nevskia sp.]|nr:hypothetical protein [Nevskia sp.]